MPGPPARRGAPPSACRVDFAARRLAVGAHRHLGRGAQAASAEIAGMAIADEKELLIYSRRSSAEPSPARLQSMMQRLASACRRYLAAAPPPTGRPARSADGVRSDQMLLMGGQIDLDSVLVEIDDHAFQGLDRPLIARSKRIRSPSCSRAANCRAAAAPCRRPNVLIGISTKFWVIGSPSPSSTVAILVPHPIAALRYIRLFSGRARRLKFMLRCNPPAPSIISSASR